MTLIGTLFEGGDRRLRRSTRRLPVFFALFLFVGAASFPSSAQDGSTSTTASSSTTSTTASTTSTTASTTSTTASTTSTTASTASTTASTTSTSATTTPKSTTTSSSVSDASVPNTDESGDDNLAGTVSEDLAGALAVWNQRVRDKEKELETAEATLGSAENRLVATTAQIDAIRSELADLEVKVAERAISAFKDQDLSDLDFISYGQVQEATRMKTLLALAVNQNFDVAEELRQAQEDLAIQQAIADDAKEEADGARAVIAEELVELEKARDQKASLTAKAAASLGVVTEDDIVTVRGFRVHRDVADAIGGMVDHAASEGIKLGGGAYRSFESQIEVRKNNCGTSYYAIWQMPSSSCRPPTARPGASMHERGMALDFTCDGGLIRSRSSRCFQWLAANAANYGFKNLPSEPWHWSVNGR
ncbi:MAG: D-alanyl-D-alanine carboxypeptidase family protein [Acidimicrobiia bacterium]|nr:D-alanyl-D-alanine carboxypeptidase family protein [Acidimicrobiia bacterium]MDH5519334.1 D-alanyl-D-alanine carboxypeptidase family protein [Acidimicrobiia bacterium]